MSEFTVTRVVTVANAQGLHARPADLFVRLASRFRARVEVIKGADRVDGKSVLGILTLGAQKGCQLTLEAHGEDAELALDALADLIERELLEHERRMAEEEEN